MTLHLRTTKNQCLKIKQYYDHNYKKSDHHNVFAEEINKITISPNDDKRLQTFNGITTYPIGTNAFKVCKSEMLARIKGKPIATYCGS